MSLDMAILGSDGRPKNWVGISVVTHFNLIQLTKINPKTFFSRIEDYYTDNDCLAELPELNELQSEVVGILKGKLDKEIKNFLEELLKLIEAAKHQEKPLAILSD
jgi:hypothetical protein